MKNKTVKMTMNQPTSLKDAFAQLTEQLPQDALPMAKVCFYNGAAAVIALSQSEAAQNSQEEYSLAMNAIVQEIRTAMDELRTPA